MQTDCRWIYDIECPYASGHQECEGCDKYEKDTRKHPLEEEEDRGCAEYHLKKDMGEI
jgi:hypothetical protein